MGCRKFRNVHGDEINYLDCRSIWYDPDLDAFVKCNELYEPTDEKYVNYYTGPITEFIETREDENGWP